MIVANLMGGLGNQMFQYAAGRSLAILNNTELYLDLGFLNTDPQGAYTKREFNLDVFNIKAKISDKAVPDKFKSTSSWISKIASKFRTGSVSFFNEEGKGYRPEFYNCGDNTYLNGFWQSEKYFSKIRTELLSEFTPKVAIDKANDDILQKIRNTNAVSLHIRRGDYATLESANKFHGLLSLEYYQKAISEIEKKQNDPVYFIFSDDIQWANEHLKLKNPAHFISGNIGRESYKDIWLMKHCKHNIIANSSFSWWGAWLNASPSKIVISPKQWSLDPSHNISDIYSQGSILL
jgi:hypothetical protein